MSYLILVAEDEDFLSKALEDNLTLEGYDVEVAKDGNEAVAKIQKKKPDLILLDLLMPRADGFYVLEQLKGDPKWKLIPIIVLSNLGDDTTIKRALEMGADDYFVKSQHPIEEVVDKVKEYISGEKTKKFKTTQKSGK